MSTAPLISCTLYSSGGASGKESTANAGDVCSILGSGRSLEGGNDNLL